MKEATSENNLIALKRPESTSTIDSEETLQISTIQIGGEEEKVNITVDNDLGGSCGWFCFRPKFLRGLRSIKGYLFFVCLASIIQGVLVNGFVNVFISTLERRYQLSSTESGIIIGSYDIASFVTVLPISYFGGRPGASKPRWIAVGIFFMGLGSLVFAVPQFTSGLYQATQTDSSIPTTCLPVDFNSTLVCKVGSESEVPVTLNNYKYVFILAQLLHGFGAVPLFTLAVTFIDDNVSNKMQPLYTGIYYTMSTIGPAVGFVGGGQLLRIYTDFLFVPEEEVGIGPGSSVWVGAWWLGFVITGFSSILISIPLFAFPGQLPGARAMALQKAQDAKLKAVTDDDDDEGEEVQKMSAAESLRELPQALKDLFSNPTFILLCLASAGEAFIVAGYGGFLPKVVESQFAVPASQAALIVGIVIVPAGVVGTLVGGYVVKRFKLRCVGTLRLCILFTACETLFTLCFMVYCPEADFAGVNIPYSDNTVEGVSMTNLSASCNSGCSCSLELYDPVCGADNLMYYSPCFAGCSKSSGSGLFTVFNNCSCIDSPPLTVAVQGKNISFMASRQKCNTGCNNLNLFIGLLFCFLLFLFLITMPAISSLLRCVQSNRRSFALGIQTLSLRLLGSIPGPVVFGIFIDNSCILWGKGCDGSGSCNYYNNYSFSQAMMWIGIIGCGITLLFMIAAYLAYEKMHRGKLVKKAQQQQPEGADQPEQAYDNKCFQSETL